MFIYYRYCLFCAFGDHLKLTNVRHVLLNVNYRYRVPFILNRMPEFFKIDHEMLANGSCKVIWCEVSHKFFFYYQLLRRFFMFWFFALNSFFSAVVMELSIMYFISGWEEINMPKGQRNIPGANGTYFSRNCPNFTNKKVWFSSKSDLLPVLFGF